MMINSNEESHVEGSGMINFLQEEVEKIKNTLPPSYDSIAEFLAITRPIVEITLMNCGDWTDQVTWRSPGKPAFSHISMMLIHMLSKMRNVSYRQIEREINAHPSWLRALHLAKCPSHSTLSVFRSEKGEQFFKAFFQNLTDLFYRYQVVDSEEVIVDSAPILASMNFARANTTPKINLDHVEEFFTAVDVSPAVEALYIAHKRKYHPAAIIRFFMFEKLGGFLSTSQALTFVEETPEIAEILGFERNQIPSQSVLSYFLKVHGPVPELLRPMVEAVTDFFEECEATPEETDIDFFFWSF